MPFLKNLNLLEKSLAKIPPHKGFLLLLYVRWVGGWWGDGAVVLDDVFVTHVKLGRGVPVRQKGPFYLLGGFFFQNVISITKFEFLEESIT